MQKIIEQYRKNKQNQNLIEINRDIQEMVLKFTKELKRIKK